MGPAGGQRKIYWQLFLHLLLRNAWAVRQAPGGRALGAQVAAHPAGCGLQGGAGACAGHGSCLPSALQEPGLGVTDSEVGGGFPTIAE